VGEVYSLPVDSLGKEELDEECARLTMQAKTSFGVPPPPFPVWVVQNDTLRVPRFYGMERFGPAETDDRVDGEALPSGEFQGSMTAVQERALQTILPRYLQGHEVEGGCMISLPCGMGKTVLSVKLITLLGRCACILVHKGVIRDQWKAAFERFAPHLKVGFVQGRTWEVDGYDVVIAMVMTLAKRQYDPQVFDRVGVVVADEAHHLAAPVLNAAMRSFRARVIVGLSATKDRPDGLTPLLHWVMGPEGFRAERDSEPVMVSLALFPDACREVLTRDGKPLVAVMINQLAKDVRRNAFIADRIATYRRSGRVIMVLSDRVDQLTLLCTLAIARGVPETDIGFFKGSTPEAARAEQLARPIVLCTFQMANEGVDKKEADTCILATPKGRIVQAVGRVQRPCEGKKPPLVLDVADNVSIFQALRWKRQHTYSKEHYRVQVHPYDAPVDRWFG
jgi:superfamily II DNA or RNA helicase